MIATIAPNQGNVENTLNTLRYAFRVKEMKHKGSSNPTNEPNTYSPATSMNSTNGALYEGADTTLNGMPKTSGSKVFQDYYQETSPFIGDENGSLYNSSLLEDLECESKDNKPLWSPIKSALTSPIKSIVKSPPVTVKKIKTVATDVATSSPILTSSSSLRKISTVLVSKKKNS